MTKLLSTLCTCVVFSLFNCRKYGNINKIAIIIVIHSGANWHRLAAVYRNIRRGASKRLQYFCRFCSREASACICIAVTRHTQQQWVMFICCCCFSPFSFVYPAKQQNGKWLKSSHVSECILLRTRESENTESLSDILFIYFNEYYLRYRTVTNVTVLSHSRLARAGAHCIYQRCFLLHKNVVVAAFLRRFVCSHEPYFILLVFIFLGHSSFQFSYTHSLWLSIYWEDDTGQTMI